MVKLKIGKERTAVPSDRRIFGNFIESGFGRQVSGMWSEMLYNRAFRDVPETKTATWEWLGLDREHYNRNAPFWHSGYEEFGWEPSGRPVLSHTCGTHTFKGTTSLMAENREGTECGLIQRGIHLKKGREYRFRIFAGIRGDIGEAGLNGFGDTIRDDGAHRLTVTIGGQQKELFLTTVSALFEWEFAAMETEETQISLTFSFPGTLILAFASLMPCDNLGGFRKEFVEKLREAAPGAVRFPGGCFVSFYNWESSIGDRDRREPQTSFYWGGLEENDVGLDEFLELSGLVGFEPQICFNMMTSEPFKARQLVEYLNAPEDTGMGRLRMLNGHAAPYGVKLFEMDNEPGRKWTARQYAGGCVAFAEEMRLADPSIELMLAAYAYPPELLGDLLEITGREIQYVIYRRGDPEFVHKILSVIREYNRKNGTDLRLVNTEWLPSCHSPEPFEDQDMPVDFQWHAQIANHYSKIFAKQQMSWNYALNGAHRLLDYISYGGEFAIANFNNMCNTWGQNIIEATKDGCYLSCMGRIFAMFAEVFEPCTASIAVTGQEGLFALETEAVNGKRQLYLVNHLKQDIEAELPEGIWKAEKGLRGSSRMAHETETEHCSRECLPEISDGRTVIPGLSFICLVRQQSR